MLISSFDGGGHECMSLLLATSLSTGKHLLLIICNVISSEAILPILRKLHLQHCRKSSGLLFLEDIGHIF